MRKLLIAGDDGSVHGRPRLRGRSARSQSRHGEEGSHGQGRRQGDDLKYTDKIKVTLLTGKDGDPKEGKLEDFEKRIKGKGGKGGNKIDVTIKDGEITEAKFRAAGRSSNPSSVAN